MSQAPSATARAQPNIALVKYWGKRDAALNLPAVGSLSVTLGNLYTETTVTLDESLPTPLFAQIAEAIARASSLQVGSGHGPLHHFHALWQ